MPSPNGAHTAVARPGSAAARLTVAVLLVIAYAVGSGVAGAPAPAWADTKPPDTATPTTVSSDPLPTVQIDGVVWDQAVVGNTVYAGGNFQTARPAGAPASTKTVSRPYLLAYDLTTGVLVPTFAPVLNGQVRAVIASADGSTLYVGGDFTTVNGIARTRLAAFDTKTGALKPGFTPIANAMVKAMAVTPTTLYLAGNFTTLGSATRRSIGAVNATTGAVTGFNPIVTGGYGESIAVPPKDTSRVVIGGRFITTNGSDRPGYGMAIVDSATGRTNLPLKVNDSIRNATNGAAITSLHAAADGFYGTGFASAGGSGNFEGTFKATWDGDLTWLEDCHGDTYSVFQGSSVTSPVYIAGHPHYCGNIGGFPRTESWTYQRALAFTPDAQGVVGPDSLGASSWQTRPRPDPLTWFPDLNVGLFTGQYQGPWTVTGNDDYVVYGGEFTAVNGTPQQGIVRFAKPTLAPNDDGPRLNGASFVPTLQSFSQGVRVSWPANYDRDNSELTYTVIRDGVTAINTSTSRSTFWQRPHMSYLDTAVKTGSHTYRIVATDPFGNRATGKDASITAKGGPTLSPYDQRVLNDDPTFYWPLDDTAATSSSTDLAGNGGAGTRPSSVTAGVPGAVVGESGTAYRFSGGADSHVSTNTATPGLQTLSVETWFKTTSNAGGRLIGFSSDKTGSSTAADRHLYLTSAGRIYWGTARPSANNGAGLQTISTPATGYNNGRWHHVVAVQDPQLGSQLFVDGARVAVRSDYFLARVFTGFWRLGGDTLATWPEAPSSGSYAGDLDDPAVYNVALTAKQILAHYTLGTGGPPAADAVFASDSFDRTSASGFGVPDTGGPWTASSSFNSVSGGAGRYRLNPGVGPDAYHESPTRSSTDLTVNATVDKMATGSGLYLTAAGRRVSAKLQYHATVQLTSTGRATLTLGALRNSSTGTSLAPSVLLPDTIKAGTTFHLRLQITGTAPTKVRAKLWLNGQSEPTAWTATASDSYAGLQTTGSVGFKAYASPDITNAPVTVSLLDLAARPVG